ACDALRATPEFSEIACDFTAAPAERHAAREAAIARFVRIYGERATHVASDDPLSLDARLAALRHARDERPTTISE
ncbi:MAG TPA: hypothetical protein VLJ38_06345, partial [Polyangiaceae bacterium]|nr:hypothetical protein [Polyangiaceae bacterium]